MNFGGGLDAYRMVGVVGPVLPLLDKLGLAYQFDEKAKQLTVKHGDNVVQTRVADSEMYVNGVPGIINDWPELIDGVLYGEISAIIPALGLRTHWTEDGKGYCIVTE